MQEKMYMMLEERFGHDLDAFPMEDDIEIRASIAGLLPENLEKAIENFEEYVDECSTVYDFFGALGKHGLLKSNPEIVGKSLRLRYNRYLGNGHGVYCQVSATPEGHRTCSAQSHGSAYFAGPVYQELDAETANRWMEYLSVMSGAIAASGYREYRKLFWERSPLIAELAGAKDDVFDFLKAGCRKKDAKVYGIKARSRASWDFPLVFALLHVGKNFVSIETKGSGCYTIEIPEFEAEFLTKDILLMCAKCLIALAGCDIGTLGAPIVDRYSGLHPINTDNIDDIRYIDECDLLDSIVE